MLGHLISTGAVQRSTADAIAEGLYAGNSELLEKAAAAYLEKTISYYDAGSEAFYHGLLLGLAAMMDTDYKVLSERESGDGRYDICLIPRRTGIPGILIEIKWGRNLSDEKLAELSEEAYAQIEERNYAAEMKQEGIKDILKLGAAFSGKKVKMTSSASAS
ncbi:MAG: PD-(D/E)XK nuclease domain-containing protein [Bulleidia sp.]|nr:PD-(D/E)XK nuclease domain-containing protein [Bulleidia sp.]